MLMRHGKPLINQQGRLNAAEFGAWVEKYNVAGIDTKYPPLPSAIEQISESAFIVCSDLVRSLESTKILGAERIDECASLFREMDMPHAAWRLPKLSIPLWTAFFRLAWVLGYSANVESFKAGRQRAQCCAEHLVSMASTHGSVLFVGHGSLNWLIAKYLTKMGWQSSGKSLRNYWQHTVFTANTIP
ncbi:histidine phosphatase family protein [Serratia aquatilis]|uniref:Histidine phosphatase family protein n=1 Tax=Serratia aquatilis TaxID=1737515 RepID=A0ABV6EGI6_9GAMM